MVDRILGRPLATYEEEDQLVGPAAGVPMLGLDALSSAAYGPEAALTILLPLGAAGLYYIGPITLLLLALLGILYVSYRQTIRAYPGGGGSYTVAKENLGVYPGLVAAAALMLDYVLNVAVGISAGVGALVSALPVLHPYILPLCLLVLVLVTIANLRGIKESGLTFALPTYLFAGTLGLVLLVGLYKALTSAGHPVPVDAPPVVPLATASAGLWIFIKAFSSGCTAMTGVEAVSNGVSAFRQPRVKNAQATLTIIIVILALLLGGIAYLSQVYQIGATDPTGKEYQSILSQLVAAVVGRNWLYYLTLGSTLLVLCFSANTSFAGFPRLCRLIADDDYLPRFFALRGRRLVYTMGIMILSGVSGLLLIAFGGITDRLIPLFAIGAFGAFTLSQAGMVVHWRHSPEPSGLALMINGLGTVATGIALLVVLVAKFADGAWITVMLLPALIYMFLRTKAHYQVVTREMGLARPLDTSCLTPPVVLLPIRGWTTMSERGLQLGLELSQDVIAICINVDDKEVESLQKEWADYVEAPLVALGRSAPELRVKSSPYRDLIRPLRECIQELKAEFPGRTITVVVPELVELQWYYHFLHNQRAMLLKAALLFSGDRDVVVLSVPFYLGCPG